MYQRYTQNIDGKQNSFLVPLQDIDDYKKESSQKYWQIDERDWKSTIQYKRKSKSDPTLIFESRFESGNLCTAIKINRRSYYLLLQNDINSDGSTQWFYFKVKNTTKDLEVTFNIMNLVCFLSLVYLLVV